MHRHVSMRSDLVSALPATSMQARELARDMGETPGAIQECLVSRRWREVSTNPDGVCSVHAVFGVCCPYNRWLHCDHARRFLARLLHNPLSVVEAQVRPHMRHLLSSVVSALWADCIAPYFRPDVALDDMPHEEMVFLQRLQHPDNRGLWDSVQAQAACNVSAQQQRDDTMRICLFSSASIFNSELEGAFWRALGAQIGVLPNDPVDFSTLTPDRLQVFLTPTAAQHVSPYEFLDVPWEHRNGQCVVKGTSAPFIPDTHGGPHCKYGALFDPRHAFDNLRFSFLKLVCGDSIQKLEDALDNSFGLLSVTSTNALRNFFTKFSGVLGSTELVTESPFDFAERAWPVLVECMCDDTMQYYLSVAELLLVCELCSKNVMIFGTRGSLLHFRGGVLGHGNKEPVLVALNEETGATRVRGHFQRLISTEHLAHLESEHATACAKQMLSGRDESADTCHGCGANPFRGLLCICNYGLAYGGAAEESQEEVVAEAQREKWKRKHAQWMNMFGIRVEANRAETDAGEHLRNADTRRGALSNAVGAGTAQSQQQSLDIDEDAHTCQQCGANPFRGVPCICDYEAPVDVTEKPSDIDEDANTCEQCGGNSFRGLLCICHYEAPAEVTEGGSVSASTAREKRKPSERKEEAHKVADETRDDADMDAAHRQKAERKHVQWMSMFGISVQPNRVRKPEADILLEAADLIANSCLRDRVTLPADPANLEVPWLDVATGGRLPPVSCAFRGCNWSGGGSSTEAEFRHDCEHPWDQQLRAHVLHAHSEQFFEELQLLLPRGQIHELMWDLYKGALSARERRSIPVVGFSVERRALEYTAHIYNDNRIRALICFACAQIKVDTGRMRSDIEFCNALWLFGLPKGSLIKNFSMEEFTRRYREAGSPLAAAGGARALAKCPDFSDWQLCLHPQWMDLVRAAHQRPEHVTVAYLENLAPNTFLCCPEDLCCEHGCAVEKLLCPRCRVPICRECQILLARNRISPHGLINDNWYGYVDSWIFEVGLTWMEKTTGSPFWTGLTLFTIGRRGGDRKSQRRHMMHDAMYSAETRVAFKGQVYSAPMDWADMQQQLQEMEKQESVVALPVVGSVLASRVQISIASGLVDLNKCIKQATVRRPVVVQYIRMQRDAGHPDYQRVDMRQVELTARKLADTDEPSIPHGLVDVLDGDGADGLLEGMDKAATPAERPSNLKELTREMDKARPLIMLSQRDSDVHKEVAASRVNALSVVSTLQVRTGSALIDQFVTSYIPRVFSPTLPWCVGGPDFRGQTRYRRKYDDAPAVSLDSFGEMIGKRVESQIRWDWELAPALWSLCFASKVNLGVSMSIKRALRRGGEGASSDRDIGSAAARIFHLLWHGQYLSAAGHRVPMKGDVSKISQIIGLTATERALLTNYHFMSSRLAGTRQIRRSIGHLLFSSRVVYGLPVFMTVTPSERHSGLAVRLSRYRRSDPGITSSAQDFMPWIGFNAPSLTASDMESVDVELPEYDLRRLMTARDPLCCLNAFWVLMTVVLPSLYGLRMCPHCPKCVTSRCPCMDVFGSNGTPMGGSAGRADALVGAVEAQKAEGVLHLHLFLFLQMLHQFMTLHDIAEHLRQGLVSVEAMKTFVSFVRSASYSDVDAFNKERESIEAAWPEYRTDFTLSRPPAFIFNVRNGMPMSATNIGSSTWCEEGDEWRRQYQQRLQHVQSRMNHHIHPRDNATGERRPLSSCVAKGKPNACKGGFPLDDQMCDHPLFVCACVAESRGLCTSGPRSLLGTILPWRNEPWLNAGPSAWLVFAGDNGDLKFPHRMPLIAETHEKSLIYDVRRTKCVSASSSLQLTYDMQAGQAVAAGYFGGYSAKMQDIGAKELQRMHQAVSRKTENEARGPTGATFHTYSKRLLKDLEAKGILRTSVESLNLLVHVADSDCLSAECVRTFATVTFPASQLLKREEVETLTVKGHSVIAAVFASRTATGQRLYTEAPFDLMYGFRGNAHVVDLLSPFEMLMHWSMERVQPPSPTQDRPTSVLTPAGLCKVQDRKRSNKPVELLAGVDYVAMEAPDRILLPEVAPGESVVPESGVRSARASGDVLGGLRHRWYWQKRPRPFVPVWSYAKIPKVNSRYKTHSMSTSAA